MSGSSRSRRWLAILATVLLALVAVALLAPWYAKKRLVEDAKARGVTLAVDDVTVGFGRAGAKNVVATVDAVPSAKITIPSLTVDLDFFTPTRMVLHAPVISGDGSLEKVRSGLASPAATSPSSGSGSQLRIELENGIVTWTHPWADAVATGDPSHESPASLDARAIAGYVVLGADDTDLTGDVSLTVRTLTFGAYHGSFVRKGDVTTVRLGAPAGPAFAEYSVGATSRDLTINVPKSKAADLGIPSAALGLVAADDTQGELHVDHHEKADAAEGHVTFSADKVYVGHTPAPTAVALDVRYAGKGDKWPVTGGSIQAGPFKGDVTGSVEPTKATVLVHLESTTQAMSCADAVKAAAAQAVGDLAAGTASAFAQLFGMDKAVTGDVKLFAKLDADLRNLAQTKVSFRTEGACVLSFLPAGP